MKESFYFSNMCPQHPQLNRRGWKNLEEKIRDWAIADSAVIVICGPIIERESKTIGKNKVAVPQQFFKVVLSPFVKPMPKIGRIWIGVISFCDESLKRNRIYLVFLYI